MQSLQRRSRRRNSTTMLRMAKHRCSASQLRLLLLSTAFLLMFVPMLYTLHLLNELEQASSTALQHDESGTMRLNKLMQDDGAATDNNIIVADTAGGEDSAANAAGAVGATHSSNSGGGSGDAVIMDINIPEVVDVINAPDETGVPLQTRIIIKLQNNHLYELCSSTIPSYNDHIISLIIVN